MNWINVNTEQPPVGVEVLLFNPLWINEDFTPKGIRVGFLNDEAGWISAYWCNYHDDYHTRTSDADNSQFELFQAEHQIPTHWMNLPENPDSSKPKN